MSFTADKLMLTDNRREQLTAALANTDLDDPLATCIAEAEADVARFTAGYTIDQSSLDGWIRALALWKAFVVAELGVPEDIQKAYDEAIAELKDIALGKRPNLPRTDDAEDNNTSTGNWGSDTKIT